MNLISYVRNNITDPIVLQFIKSNLKDVKFLSEYQIKIVSVGLKSYFFHFKNHEISHESIVDFLEKASKFVEEDDDLQNIISSLRTVNGLDSVHLIRLAHLCWKKKYYDDAIHFAFHTKIRRDIDIVKRFQLGFFLSKARIVIPIYDVINLFRNNKDYFKRKNFLESLVDYLCETKYVVPPEFVLEISRMLLIHPKFDKIMEKIEPNETLQVLYGCHLLLAKDKEKQEKGLRYFKEQKNTNSLCLHISKILNKKTKCNDYWRSINGKDIVNPKDKNGRMTLLDFIREYNKNKFKQRFFSSNLHNDEQFKKFLVALDDIFSDTKLKDAKLISALVNLCLSDSAYIRFSKPVAYLIIKFCENINHNEIFMTPGMFPLKPVPTASSKSIGSTGSIVSFGSDEDNNTLEPSKYNFQY